MILAAGQKVYLQASDDPELRGLLVEVDAGGKAWNQLTGEIATPLGQHDPRRAGRQPGRPDQRHDLRPLQRLASGCWPGTR